MSKGDPVVGMANVVEAGTGHAAHAEPHADLPKHAFGSCSICTRRLLASQQAAPVVVPRPRSRTALPTRYLVQTSPVVSDRVDDGRN
jgi:hypothetical protein